MINYQWISMVSAGLLTHIYQVGVAGLDLETRKPDGPSMLFCFALCILIANFNWWPRSLRKRPKLATRVFRVVVPALLVDIIMRTVYISLQGALKWLLEYPMKFKPDYPKLEKVIDTLASQDTFLATSSLVSLGIIILVTYVTGHGAEVLAVRKIRSMKELLGK